MVASPVEAAWDVVSDMSAFGDAAPNLSKAEVLDGAGEGMHRRCFDSRGRGSDEVCTLWQEEIESRFENPNRQVLGQE